MTQIKARPRPLLSLNPCFAPQPFPFPILWFMWGLQLGVVTEKLGVVTEKLGVVTEKPGDVTEKPGVVTEGVGES